MKLYMIIHIYRHGYCVKCHFQHYFSYIMATSFSGGGSRSAWSARREPPIMGKKLVNFITCGCESSAPFFGIYKAGRELIEPPGPRINKT